MRDGTSAPSAEQVADFLRRGHDLRSALDEPTPWSDGPRELPGLVLASSAASSRSGLDVRSAAGLSREARLDLLLQFADDACSQMRQWLYDCNALGHHHGLAPREAELGARVGMGFRTHRGIAAAMGVGLESVRTTRKRAQLKLEVSGLQAIASLFAWRGPSTDERLVCDLFT